MKKTTRNVVSSSHCGVFPNWGGGLLLKLALRGGPPRVLALQTEWAFYLRENLQRSVIDGKFADPRDIGGHTGYAGVLDSQPTISQADFQSADATSTVSGWDWHVFSDAVAVEFQLLEGDAETYLFPPEVVFLLLDYVDSIIECGDLVDLRAFRSLRVHEMEEEIQTSEGYALIQAYEHFELTRRLLDRNCEELLAHLQQFQGGITNPDFVLWTRRHSVHLFMEEALRLLHNFVAACISMIDHSRVFFCRLAKESRPLPRYQDEVDRRFKNDPLSQFVVGLRQFAQRYRLPSISTVRKFGSNEIQGRVHLLKDDLLLFSGWNAAAKRFLQEQSDKIDLVEVLREYHQKVAGFQEWLRQEWSETFWQELRETELKRQAMLAKKGEELISEMRRLIEHSKPRNVAQLVELFSRLLSPQELHELHELEIDPPELTRRAVGYAERRYLLPDDLKDQLRSLGRFDEGG